MRIKINTLTFGKREREGFTEYECDLSYDDSLCATGYSRISFNDAFRDALFQLENKM